VIIALEMHREGYRRAEIASITGINQSNLSQIVRRISWTRLVLDDDADGDPRYRVLTEGASTANPWYVVLR
jgi:hypothetical protein